MKQCYFCFDSDNIDTAKFCSNCAKPFPAEVRRIYASTSPDEAFYTLTFVTRRERFSSLDSLREAARHASWNEDEEFADYTFERHETAVPVSEFPFVCSCGLCVSTSDKKFCEQCDKQDWKRREEDA